MKNNLYPKLIPSGTPKSEIVVRERLEKISKITCLHSITWQSKRNDGQADGEADFILLVPGKGVLILEVKGGGVDIVDGDWFTKNAKGTYKIKDPFVQAKDSKYALISFLKIKNKKLSKIPVVHAVCFPDVTVENSISFGKPRELIIDRKDLRDLYSTILKVFEYWGKKYVFSKNFVNNIMPYLMPNIVIKRLLVDNVEDAMDSILELTIQQMEILKQLKKVNRACILGGAGTGKTLLALEKARREGLENKKVLFLCYNKLLCEHIYRTNDVPNIKVNTFHGFAFDLFREAGYPIPANPSNKWYLDQVPDMMVEAIGVLLIKYDAVIVDEAQDFHNIWLDVIELMLHNENGLFYLFADTNQNLHCKDWSVPQRFVEFHLTKNCRNTNQIFEKFNNVHPEETENSGKEGPIPVFVILDKQSGLIGSVIVTAESLIFEGKIDPLKIIVLSNDVVLVRQLKESSIQDNQFTNVGRPGIQVETITRFKGLEKEVVILVLTDAIINDNMRENAYVAISRAQAALYVIGSKKIKSKLNWS